MSDYDRIIKENIEAIFLPILGKFLGLSIKSTFEIKDKIQSTIEREPDFLKRIIDQDDKEFILHVEFQTADDLEMVYRMAEYDALLQRKYQIPVKPFVIYLGSSPPKMRTKLYRDEQIKGFELINIREISTEDTLSSDIPEEIILTILTDYEKADAGQIIKRILEKLEQSATSEIKLRRLIKQLHILSRLRKLDQKIQRKVSKMPIEYDFRGHVLFKEGMEEGDERRRRQVILRGLKLGVPIAQIAEMAEVDIQYVLKLQQESDGGSKV